MSQNRSPINIQYNLDGDLCKNVFDFHIFFFFWFSITILPYTLFYPYRILKRSN